jgi:hypothetical protein
VKAGRRETMQPRGQLWFALQDICQDFRDYSGLGEKEALQVLVAVLTNLLAEQQAALEKLTSPEA